MRYFFANNLNFATTYTYELLKHLARKNNHEITEDVGKADAILLSLTSFYEFNELLKLRKNHKEKIIIVGGHACNSPEPLLHYANYVNLGQGFEFFKLKSFSEIEQAYFIVHKNKKHGKYSDLIEWNLLPIVQISKNSYSYLESVGCKYKCSFCLTSWTNKYQKNPNDIIIKNIEEKYAEKQLYFIGNNYERPNTKIKVSDATIKKYNENPLYYDNISLIRVGLESPSQETRYMLKKRISDEEVKKFFYFTKKYKKRANIFMIAGLDSQETWENFTEILGDNFEESHPSLNFIINYLDPSKGTPLEHYDLRKIIPINIPRIKRIWKLKNARIVIFRDLKISWKNSTIDALLQRTIEKEKIEYLWKLRKKVFDDFDDFISELEKNGFSRELSGNYEYNYEIEYPYKIIGNL